MTDRKAKLLIIFSAVFLLFAGFVLYIIFDRQGLSNKTNGYVNYIVSDYVEIYDIIYENYYDVYGNIDVSKVGFKNLDNEITKDFVALVDEVVGYVSGYYYEIDAQDGYIPVNTAVSSVKTQINGAVLSIYYRIDFNLDSNLFEDNIKSYIVTTNIDLRTNKVLSNDDLLLKYDYSKNYIADKLFIEDILIGKGQVVIDKNTNISLTRNDIERKKTVYVERIIDEFDNIINMYIENGNLVLVYDKKELKRVFFNNEYESNIIFKYLK